MKKYIIGLSFAVGFFALIQSKSLFAVNPNVTVYKYIGTVQIFTTPGFARIQYYYIGNNTGGNGSVDIDLDSFDISTMNAAIQDQISIKKGWNVTLVDIK